ncbi:MAG: hypothetical protein NTV24_04605, partial [Candidatus Woesebacteria bacterium]|nr:hypothetical protein [Candidatus Woesebacteria bacterium]
INGLLPGLLVDVNKKYKKIIVYASTQRIKNIKSASVGDIWTSKTSKRFQELINSYKDKHLSEKEALKFIDEYLIKNPIPAGFNIYELSKLVGEKILSKDINSIVLRISSCYGPGYSTRRTIGRLTLARLMGQKIIERDEVRDYIYTDDLNEIFAGLIYLKKGKPLVKYCCSGTSASKKYIINKILREIPNGKGILDVSEEGTIETFKPSGKWFGKTIKRKPTGLEFGLSETIKYIKKRYSTENMDSTKERLTALYDSIRQKTDEQGVDAQEVQILKEGFFNFKDGEWVASEAFWKPTGIVLGYPFSKELSDKFDSLRMDILQQLNLTQHDYWLPDKNRLHSTVVSYSHYSEVGLGVVTIPKSELKSAKKIISEHKPINISYKGVLITNNGSILVMGFVDNEELFNLREDLLKGINGIIQQPQNLAHVKVAQILTSVPYEISDRINRLYSSKDLGTHTFTSASTPYDDKLDFGK